MPKYRFFTADLLTGDVLGELPLYGTYCDKQLNAAGSFTGTFRIGTSIENDVELLNATRPRRTALYMQRDGTTIWGGILWSRTYGSQANTIQISAQTFESYLNKVVITEHFIKLATNQLQVAIDLIDLMQSRARQNIGIDTTAIDTSGGIVKNVKVPWYDYKYFGEVFGELADSEDGFDWTIDVVDTDEIDHPAKMLRLGQPIIAPITTSNAPVFDFPGTITDFYWPESGTDSGTDFILLGNGTGSGMLVSQSLWSGYEGYPVIHQIVSRKGIADQAQLDTIAQDYAATYGPDLTVPTITIKPDRPPQFNAWNNLGTYLQVQLEGPRFPTRMISTQRMVGWELSPSTGEQTEIVKLRLAGEGEESGE